MIDLDEALRELAKLDERASRVPVAALCRRPVAADTAEVLGVSHATVERDWAAARAWLAKRLLGPGENANS